MLCRVKILVLVTRTRVTFLAILEFTRDFFELRVETLEYLRVFSSIFHFPKQTNFDGGDRYACAFVHFAHKHAILRYFGHALRMENSRLPKIALHGEINQGSRPIGRPKTNYWSCIIEDLKQFDL